MSEDQVITTIAKIVNDLMGYSKTTPEQIIAIAIYSPGIIDSSQEKLIIPIQNSRLQKNFTVKKALSDALPFSALIYYDNICRYSGYYELLHNTNRWSQTIMVISTYISSIGGSLIKDGHLIHGTNGLIGEYGHITIDHASTVKCICGNYGCFESLVSSQSVCNNAAVLLPDYPDSLLSDHICENSLSFSLIFDAAEQGDRLARAVLDKVAHYFTILIYNARMICDPDEIILQYLYANSCNYFRNELISKISKHPLYHVSTDLKLTFSTYDAQSSADIGAAMYCFNNYFNTESTYN